MVGGPTQADPTTTGPIVFRVVFSLPVTDFTADDVTLGGTLAGSLSDTVAMIGTDGTTYDVLVAGMTTSGTVTAAMTPPSGPISRRMRPARTC